MFKELKEFLISENEDISLLNLDYIRDSFNKVLYYNEADDEKPLDILYDIYLNFKDMFKYEGIVYRGIFAPSNILMPFNLNEIFSFTNNLRVAENFALRGDYGCGYIVIQEINDGLNFAELLITLLDKGILLEEDVEHFINEDEVLCPIKNKYDIKLKYNLLS